MKSALSHAYRALTTATLLIAVALIQPACTGSRLEVDRADGQCFVDEDCPGGRCVDGLCVGDVVTNDGTALDGAAALDGVGGADGDTFDSGGTSLDGVAEDVAPNATEDVAEDVAPDTTGDVAEDVAADTTEDVAPDTTEDVAPDTTEDVAPDTTEDVAPDTTEDVAPDTTEDVDEDVAPDTTEDVVEDIAPDTTADVVEDIAPDTTADVVEDIAPDTTADVVEDIAPDTTNDADVVPPVCVGKETLCDGLDDDCNGLTDEGVCPTTQVTGKAYTVPGGLPVAGVSVSLHPAGTCALGGATSLPIASTSTAVDGSYTLLAEPGSYCVQAAKAGFKPLVSENFAAIKNHAQWIDLPMADVGDITPWVSLCAEVTEVVTGAAIAGATVGLAANKPTNIIGSGTTNVSGTTCITALPAQGAALYYAHASASGYDPDTLGPRALVPQVVAVVQLALAKSTATYCFDDNFDNDAGWVATAPAQGVVWHRRDTKTELKNAAANLCVTIPPDEFCTPNPADFTLTCPICAGPTDSACTPSPGALPRAVSGDFAAWFGHKTLGNYLGDLGKCSNKDGGASKGPIAGSYTSPPILINAKASALRLLFWTWFEIEGKNPDAAYDAMTVLGSSDGKAFSAIATLNPSVQLNGSSDTAFTSAGHNKAPRWSLADFALPPALEQQALKSGKLWVRFSFDTKDSSFNGFRGWLIDIVRVVGSDCTP